MGNLKAGFARVDVTPNIGYCLEGSYNKRVSEGVLDNLYATNAIDYGDGDKNGSKNASDALTTLKSSVGSVSLTNEEKTIADVSGEGKITAWDAMLILKYSGRMYRHSSPLNRQLC